jgi:hypothetical protein
MTALVLSIGGSVLTKRSECLSEFIRIREKYVYLDWEITSRREYAIQSLESSTYPSDFFRKMEHVPTAIHEFDGVTTKELITKRGLLASQIEYEQGLPQFIKTIRRIETRYNGLFSLTDAYALIEVLGAERPKLTPRQVSFFKTLLMTPPLNADVMIERQERYLIGANCSFPSIFKSIFTGGMLRPAFVGSVFPFAFRDATSEIESLKKQFGLSIGHE